MTLHELKCWPDFYARVISGEKMFEIRQNDREYHGGDQLWLREWHPTRHAYTGRECVVDVPYLLAGAWPGLMDGYVVMSIRLRDTFRVAEGPKHEWEFYMNGSFCKRCGAQIGSGMPCR